MGLSTKLTHEKILVSPQLKFYVLQYNFTEKSSEKVNINFPPLDSIPERKLLMAKIIVRW